MSVNVLIKRNDLSMTIQDIASLKDLNFGVFDSNYKLEFDKIDSNTILYDKKCIGRGIEISIEDFYIHMWLPLPTTCYEIELFYELIKCICEKMTIRKSEMQMAKEKSINVIITPIKTAVKNLSEPHGATP